MGVIEKIREKDLAVLVRFGLSSLVTIAIKIAITWFFSYGLNEYLSYFLTHFIILFWSYYSHLRFTFRSTHSTDRFWAYCKAVIFIKLLDFALFGLFFSFSSEQLSVSVLLASVIVSLVRFLTIRKALDIDPEPKSNRRDLEV